ncbi:hypothetical protein BX616_000188 [Lobosporangium transversale]|uniref:Uncharacterized protein n=1 Tax=Lobosporangium transversale TaxID=64571 RepID=A0A1Y2H7C8_9FUNG|nr:hypothetical protein BCR41DRAFT_344323 [Lobosporangium transversale]KAF9908327.1 hypothetical protein BX616_000188 [Lobosporangium transversale]ORZ28942.1 hypothetical protein BCR41DRAFT_344323 [Lobosporangium transversale]|eukprot:XP_021886615.1 hypothetical protein BCR41DRAFT_344323 [Lobosporangium transversale]
MPSAPILGRSLILFVGCAVFFQLILFFKSNFSSSSDFDQQFSSQQNRDWPSDSSNNWNEHVRNRHPSVQLSLRDYEVLDELAEKIATTESYRVFENKDEGRIHGTNIKKDPTLVRKIREQIQCWTTHGSWQRQDGVFTPLKHLGDSRFAKCDRNFIKALDQEGSGHYLGEFDHANERFLVREAVKYKWVPDEKICGPGSGIGVMGLEDDRAKYQPYTKQSFCQVINQRDVLVVGDLTQYQIHDVLLSAFQSSFACYGELGCLHHSAHGLCQNVGLKYARNDVLSVPWAVDPEEEEYPSATTVEQAWATEDMLLKYKVLILNRGLFWRTDEVFLSELVFTMKHLWKYYPDTLIIYRATHPLSSNCSQLKNQGEDEAIADKYGNSVVEGTVLQKPLKEPPKRQIERQANGEEYRPSMADIQRQNRIAKRVVEAAGGIYLDTEAMFALRHDGRMGDGDCARFCAPGPLDAYVDLIYNTLRILQV